MEYVLETLHFTGGLPWWGSAIAASLIIRMILVKATIGASDTAAKLNLVKDTTKPLNEKMMAAYSAGDQAEMMLYKRKVMKIHEQNGIKTWRAFLPMLQIPFGFGVFRVMRAMADLPVPGLEEESVLWMTDVSVCDPYYVLPVATGAMMYFAMKKGGDSGTANIANTSVATGLRTGLPIGTALFMAWWPGILQLYFTTSGAWSLAQAYALQNGRLRSMMGIAPLPNRDAASTAEAKMFHLRTLAEQAKEAEEQPKESKIDQWVGQMKETTDGVTGMFKKKAEKKEAHERFTESQLREAREWEKKRAEEEDTERNSYNSRMKEEWEAMQRRKERQQQRLRGASSSKKDGRDRR
ncbi:hypothetical protein KEM56_000603 [Ascosphaera pollenicola]|nr:hypothetical protein KEM56_000603 [Ascosphaera pollenicola]